MVTIYPESAMPDGNLSNAFPYLLKIDPLEKSFYTALGFSVLYRLACVSSVMKKEVNARIKLYLNYELSKPNINVDLKIAPEVKQGVDFFPQILEAVLNPSSSLQDIEGMLKANAQYICSAFQVILAAIFAKSSKIQEAQDILDGKKVLFQNKYYFENFAKSLALRIVIHAHDEPEIISIDDNNADRVNIELYVLSKQTCEFCIMRHAKEIELIRSNDNSGVNDMPFIFIRKPKHIPIGNSGLNQVATPPNYNNPPPNLPGNYNNYSPPPVLPSNLPQSPAYSNLPPTNIPQPPVYSNSMPTNIPQPPVYSSPAPAYIPQVQPTLPSYPNEPQSYIPHVVASTSAGSSLKADSNFIDLMLPIILKGSVYFTKTEARSLKKIIKSLRSKDKSKITESVKSLKESSEIYCKKNHDPSNFVIFKTCKKRHCMSCLREADDSKIICDCKREISGNDIDFLLGKTAKCIMCGLSIDDLSQKVGQTHFMHRDCALRLK